MVYGLSQVIHICIIWMSDSAIPNLNYEGQTQNQYVVPLPVSNMAFWYNNLNDDSNKICMAATQITEGKHDEKTGYVIL